VRGCRSSRSRSRSRSGRKGRGRRKRVAEVKGVVLFH
jgi:hypothetical protein